MHNFERYALFIAISIAGFFLLRYLLQMAVSPTTAQHLATGFAVGFLFISCMGIYRQSKDLKQ